MASPKYKLTYFNIKYLAEPTRYLFAYAGIDYEDIRVTHADWPNIKPDMPWKTLPVLQDGNRVIGQSLAILRYVARKHGFYGENAIEEARCDELVDAANDWRQEVHAFYRCKDEENKQKMATKIVEETMPKAMKILSDILAQNGKFLVGNKFSYTDFYVAHILDTVQIIVAKNLFDGFPSVERHQQSVFAAPGIKEWIAKRPQTPF